jgi:hypothetical protein
MSDVPLQSVPGVCEMTLVRGANAPPAPPDLLLEVPHGATLAAHFRHLRAELRGDYPADLLDFFFVNTDVGAPEVALRTAQRFVGLAPTRSALVCRSLVPRTFVDCNRIIDPAAVATASAPGALTPGLHVYVQDAHDRALLLARHRAYREAAAAAYARVCGGGGLALMVHSYAPRNVDVPVDADIVQHTCRTRWRRGRCARWSI